MRRNINLLVVCLGLLGGTARAEVVINEIFYHPPDDREDLEFIELHNSSPARVNLGGWKLMKGVRFQFPAGAGIEGGGFIVLCKNSKSFQDAYGFAAAGEFKGALGNNGDQVELIDADGKPVDRVVYRSRSPWPIAPDGYSSSLERICPGASGSLAENWAASPLPEDRPRPAGTPGRKNTAFAPHLPPLIQAVVFKPESPRPGQPITVEAEVRSQHSLREVTLRYRLVGSGFEKPEVAVVMKKSGPSTYTGIIPAQAQNQLIRFRISAVDEQGGQRFHPAVNEIRPALTVFVAAEIPKAKIPIGMVFSIDESSHRQAEKWRRRPYRGPFTLEGRMAAGLRRMHETGIDLEASWWELAVNIGLEPAQAEKLRPLFAAQLQRREEMIEKALDVDDLRKQMQAAPAAIKRFNAALLDKVKAHLKEPQHKRLEKAVQSQRPTGGFSFFGRPEQLLRQVLNLESAFCNLTLRSDMSATQCEQLCTLYRSAVTERGRLTEQARNLMAGRGEWEKLQEQSAAVDNAMAQKLKQILTAAQQKEFREFQEAANSFMPRQPVGPPAAPRGGSAFVYVEPQSGKIEVFDYVHVGQRSAGYKVRFHKDRLLNEMSTINLIFEYNDRFVLAESLAYEVYRRAGNASLQTEYVRVLMDGKLLGYHLLVEQPNRAYLRRNHLRTDGNMYKLIWYGRDLIGQHEKKTNPGTGHKDLIDLVALLERTKGDEQWQIIQKHFNVPQVINYFAVNMVLSHWDGFFNNYFAYHDVSGTGKWEMYPWDQDKTWGYYDGLAANTVFTNMPLTFGMEGDAPPGWPKDRPPPRGFGFGSIWWRPGGFFSRPLLANPSFRKLFLARTKEILTTIYTEETFVPLIRDLGDRLRDDVRLRATVMKEDPEKAVARFERNLDSLKEHLAKRRKFLLEQKDLQ